MNIKGFTILLLLLALLMPMQSAHAESLKQVEKRMKKHAKKIIKKLKKKENSVKQTVKKERKNWESKNYNAGKEKVKAAEEHPWIKKGKPKGVNPDSKKNYQEDSKNAWETQNFKKQTWSCFEPQLIAYGDCPLKQKGVTWDVEDESKKLLDECQKHCCDEEEKAWNDFKARRRLVPWDDQGDWFPEQGGKKQEYFEVIQFWFPENQAAINNYGRMRVNPKDLTGKKKNKFLRKELIKDKKNPEN